MKLWRADSPFFILIILSVIGGILPFYGQVLGQKIPSQNRLDSLSQYYELSKSDSLSIPARLQHVNVFLKGTAFYEQDSLTYLGLMRKTKLLGQIRQYDSAIVYSKQLYDLAKKNEDTTYCLKALTKLGIYYKGNNQLAEAFNYFNEVFKLARAAKDSIETGRTLLRMANIQTSLGDYSGSKVTAVDGVKYLDHSSDIRSLGGLYHIISVANRVQKNYKEAIKYNERALSLGKDTATVQAIGVKNILIFKNTKALIFANQEEYKQAIEILEGLVVNPVVKKDKGEYARVLGNLGYVQWLENKNNQDTKSILHQALQIREEVKDVKGIITNCIYLAKYYLDKDKDKALFYAESAYQNAKQQHSLSSTLEALGLIFELKENTNEEAKIYKEIHNKLLEVNQSNREIYAVTRYENDKLTNENLILKAETARKERQRIIYLFSILLVVLGGGMVFYWFEQRHKRERIREVYNAEARISKKLHDELANDVYQVMMQLQNNQNNSGVLDKLEDIYNSTRDISREHNSFGTGKEYAAELNAMLSSYSTNSTKIIIKDIHEINWQSITPEKKIIVHRTLQELMVNMKKHSQAGLVAITFKKTPKNIVITYADTGVGVSSQEIIYSNGLRNTENRIKTIGGSFIFDSEKDKGFKARIEFPN